MAFFIGLANGVIIRAALENGLLGVIGMASGCGDGLGVCNPNAGIVVTVPEFISTNSLIDGDEINQRFY